MTKKTKSLKKSELQELLKLADRQERTRQKKLIEAQQDNLYLQSAIQGYEERESYNKLCIEDEIRFNKSLSKDFFNLKHKYERLEVLVLAFVMALVLFAGVML